MKVQEGLSQPLQSRVYEFRASDGRTIVIKDHAIGHQFSDGKSVAPHYNVYEKSSQGALRQIGKAHYFYNPAPGLLRGHYRAGGQVILPVPAGVVSNLLRVPGGGDQ